MNFLIFKMLKEPKYLGLSLVVSIFLFFFYPVSQVYNQGLNNYWFWFSLLTPIRWVLYLLYVFLFGITFSFYFWNRAKKICSVARPNQAGLLGIFGFLGGIIAPLCPACLSWLFLFLPASLAITLLQYSLLMIIISIGLLFLALWLLGGFKKSK